MPLLKALQLKMSSNNSMQKKPQYYEEWAKTVDRKKSKESQLASLLAWGAEWKAWHLLPRREKRRLRQKERRCKKREIKEKQKQIKWVQERARLLQEQIDKYLLEMKLPN